MINIYDLLLVLFIELIGSVSVENTGKYRLLLFYFIFFTQLD